MPGKQMIHGGSQTVDIRSGIRLSVSAVLLRRRISLRSQAGGIRHALLLELPGGSEIDQHHLPVRLQHNIGRLHIPVNNGRLSGMKIAQHIAHLL